MAELYTAQAVLELWDKNMTREEKDAQREVKSLEKDIDTAQEYIDDAIARYRKAKLRARSKAKANSDDVFKDLEDYSSTVDIQNAYGFEMISESEMDRLMQLWELREKSKTANVYTDRVIEFLESARRSIMHDNGEPVREYYEMQSKRKKEAERIARENFSRR